MTDTTPGTGREGAASRIQGVWDLKKRLQDHGQGSEVLILGLIPF